MSKKSILLLAIAFIGLGLLVSCVPTCAEDAMVAPVAINPVDFELVGSLKPQLSWSYPDDSCKPEAYRIEIFKFPEYALFMTGTASGGSTVNWSPAENLEEHGVYKWRVFPTVGSTLGPSSDQPFFVTGPTCESTELTAPIITQPEDMAILTSLPLYVYLENPGLCIPSGNQIQTSKDSTFSDQQTYESVRPALTWMISELDDCSIYYLRAVSNNGPVFGPFSSTTTMSTNFSGFCSSEFSFYCTTDPDLFMADFLFENPVTDTFEMRFGGTVFPCVADAHNPNLLHCYGPQSQQNQSITINLWDMTTQTIVATIETKTPNCQAGSNKPGSVSVNCLTFNQTDCSSHANECKWVLTPSTVSLGVCKNK